MPTFIWFIFLTLIAPYSPAAPVRLLSDSSGLCQSLLKAKTVQLSDLVAMALVEPDGQYLYSPRELITDHEMKTATLLAERLKRSVALLPRLHQRIAVPAVDGIMFNQNGRPLNNFSLKTFFPSEGLGDLNYKLSVRMKTAQKSIELNYSERRWAEIVRKYLPHSVSDRSCTSESQLYAKIFGLTDNPVRPVSVVIDYTADPTAVFRLHMNTESAAGPQAFLTLKAIGQGGLNIMQMMERLRAHPTIKEYIFLGIHHVLSVTANRYEMTEYCDSLGHSH